MIAGISSRHRRLSHLRPANLRFLVSTLVRSKYNLRCPVAPCTKVSHNSIRISNRYRHRSNNRPHLQPSTFITGYLQIPIKIPPHRPRASIHHLTRHIPFRIFDRSIKIPQRSVRPIWKATSRGRSMANHLITLLIFHRSCLWVAGNERTHKEVRDSIATTATDKTCPAAMRMAIITSDSKAHQTVGANAIHPLGPTHPILGAPMATENERSTATPSLIQLPFQA